jgi:hypothetical protein
MSLSFSSAYTHYSMTNSASLNMPHPFLTVHILAHRITITAKQSGKKKEVVWSHGGEFEDEVTVYLKVSSDGKIGEVDDLASLAESYSS